MFPNSNKANLKVIKSDNSKAHALEEAQKFKDAISALRTEPHWKQFLSVGNNPAKIKELQTLGDSKKLHQFINQKRVEYQAGLKVVPYTEFFYNHRKLKNKSRK